MQFKKLLFTAMIATNASGIDHGRVFINGKKKFLFFFSRYYSFGNLILFAEIEFFVTIDSL